MQTTIDVVREVERWLDNLRLGLLMRDPHFKRFA